jgi:hypothetical protein
MENRRALAVLMKQQYQMQEPLASIAERFANSEQTLADAQLLSKQVLSAGDQDWKSHFEDGSLLTRVLCTDNNSKAALNWEMAKWLHQEEWYQWKAEDDASVVASNEVIDQLEPVQCAWKWMPVICLENYLGTGVMVLGCESSIGQVWEHASCSVGGGSQKQRRSSGKSGRE